jgi:hypothetical protein
MSSGLGSWEVSRSFSNCTVSRRVSFSRFSLSVAFSILSQLFEALDVFSDERFLLLILAVAPQAVIQQKLATMQYMQPSPGRHLFAAHRSVPKKSIAQDWQK